MWWIWNKRAYAGAAFGAYEVWVMVDWSLPEGVLSGLRLGTAEYAGLVTFGALCIAITIAPLANALRPSERFKKQYDSISTLRDGVKAALLKYGTDAWMPYYDGMVELSKSLEKIGISAPVFKLGEEGTAVTWYAYLSHLAAFSKQGDLKGARQHIKKHYTNRAAGGGS